MAVHVLREEEFDREMETTVAPALRKVREDGTFSGCDGRTLCYHVYRASEPRANLVVVHGFTESSEKYDELSWYFLQSGLSVYLFDHRGHGKSFRAVPDRNWESCWQSTRKSWEWSLCGKRSFLLQRRRKGKQVFPDAVRSSEQRKMSIWRRR